MGRQAQSFFRLKEELGHKYAFDSTNKTAVNYINILILWIRGSSAPKISVASTVANSKEYIGFPGSHLKC
jgi:hypothetical protein